MVHDEFDFALYKEDTHTSNKQTRMQIGLFPPRRHTQKHAHTSPNYSFFSEKAESGCRNTLAQVQPTLHLTHLNELLAVQTDSAVTFSPACGRCSTEEDAPQYRPIPRPLDFITLASLTSRTSCSSIANNAVT